MEEIRNRIMQHQISINRVPKNTYDRFMKIANNDDFCKDYGFTLKYLIDFHDGIIVHGNEQMMSEIDILKVNVNGIKQKLEEKKEKPKRRMLNGA